MKTKGRARNKNLLDSKWERNFNFLKKYREKHPDRWPVQTVRYPKNVALGRWCYEQNRKYRERLLKKEHVKLLKSIGFPFEKIVSRDSRFEKQFAHLMRFRKKHPDKWPASNTEFPKGNRLGSWCRNLKNLKGAMPKEREKALNSIGFEWDSLRAQWERNYNYVKKYLKKNKRLPPISVYSSPTERRAANWVHNRTTKLKQGKVSKEERLALKKLGIRG